MSQQALIKLVKLAENDEALVGELQAAQTDEEKAAVAARHGCDVRAEELATLRGLTKKNAGDELTDAELEMVSGGSLWSKVKSAARWVKDHIYVDTSNKTGGVKGQF